MIPLRAEFGSLFQFLLWLFQWQSAEIRQGERQTRAWGFLIALISATKKPVERSCEVMQIQSRCSSWAGLVPDLCLDEKCAPWISLAWGKGWGGCWWFHKGTVSLLVTNPKVTLPSEQLLLSVSSCGWDPFEAPGFTQGLSDLMTKPLQSTWQRNAEEFSALEGNIVAWLIWKPIYGIRSKAAASPASQLDLFIDGWLWWGSEKSWYIFIPGRVGLLSQWSFLFLSDEVLVYLRNAMALLIVVAVSMLWTYHLSKLASAPSVTHFPSGMFWGYATEQVPLADTSH